MKLYCIGENISDYKNSIQHFFTEIKSKGGIEPTDIQEGDLVFSFDGINFHSWHQILGQLECSTILYTHSIFSETDCCFAFYSI